MKFLFDENCSLSDKFLKGHQIYEYVKYRLEQGVKDEHILDHVSNKEYVIVTKDIRFALDAIGKKFKVIYHHIHRNENYFLQAGEFEPELVSEFKSFEFK
jgi:predicted nuclease of predicted toxin-antitoxin system